MAVFVTSDGYQIMWRLNTHTQHKWEGRREAAAFVGCQEKEKRHRGRGRGRPKQQIDRLIQIFLLSLQGLWRERRSFSLLSLLFPPPPESRCFHLDSQAKGRKEENKGVVRKTELKDHYLLYGRFFSALSVSQKKDAKS